MLCGDIVCWRKGGKGEVTEIKWVRVDGGHEVRRWSGEVVITVVFECISEVLLAGFSAEGFKCAF